MAVKAWSLNHWTTREFPTIYFKSSEFGGGGRLMIRCKEP